MPNDVTINMFVRLKGYLAWIFDEYMVFYTQSCFLSPLLLFWLQANLKRACQILILLATSLYLQHNQPNKFVTRTPLSSGVHSSKSG
ncbi:unnamed protein product [Lactuca virosa]|uniref:Uncharacterized protein n=1 Tax=Lactuca virosa TaxID=75947 RepID=A0AAU9PLZ3_9ASTR|nr:unnamed protein product [Lactuca virosa]